MSGDSTKPRGAPGWNDPPLFSYESRVEGARSRPSLTRRVAFPVTQPPAGPPPPYSSSNSPLPPPYRSTAGPPPPPYSTGSPLPPPYSPQATSPSPQPPDAAPCKPVDPPLQRSETDSQVDVRTVLQNLESRINDMTDEKRRRDVERRVGAMEEQWTRGDFPSLLQHRILALSHAIREGDAERGLELQRCIMVDHSEACSAWVPALRTLLHLSSEAPSQQPAQPPHSSTS